MKQKNYVLMWILTIFIFALLAAGSVVGFCFNLYILGGVLAGLMLAIIILFVLQYNKMVRYRNKIQESLSLIDIQLKMRFDLIPNLVNTVKGYAKHEKETFKETIALRNAAIAATDEQEKLELSNKLVPKMKDIVMIAEDYPELKAQSLYKSLMEQLVDIEDRIVSARRIYDSNVNLYNTLIATFPNNLVATTFKFSKEQMYKIDAGENICPKVQ
ncbi:MAG TPA: hypothetical protein DEV78_02930 [Clostridiales bacterium]|nr:hypothetical protein [Clostridiales bacterium]